MTVKNCLSTLVGLALLTGCGATGPDEEAENVASAAKALSFTAYFWTVGTFDPVNHKSYATCGTGMEMVGVAFDVDVPYVKCGYSTVSLQNPYVGNNTLLGYKAACSRSTDGAKGFTYNLVDGSNTVTCGTTSPPHQFLNTYLDGAGLGTWGQESFWVGSGAARHQVFGHVCGKIGYAAQGYNVDHDVLICGT
jgi:hypothetical protein